jgi:hypothetical protein
VVEGLSWESVARMALDIAHHASPPPSPKTGEGSAIEGGALDCKASAHPQPFGWLFEGPEGLRQFTKARDFTKPVLDLHRRMAEQEPDKYTLTALYAAGSSTAAAPSGSQEKRNG